MPRSTIPPPAARLTIDDLDTIRMMSDPTRIAILQAFAANADQPLTVKRLGQILGIPATKLYYHVGLLEERGLVRVSGTRLVSGIVEKSYRPAALAFSVDRSVFDPGDDATDEAFERMAGSIFDSTRQEVADGVRTGSIAIGESADHARRLRLTKSIVRLTPDRIEALHARLADLIEEFDTDDDQPGSVAIAWLSVLYPLPTRDARAGSGHRRTARKNSRA